MKGNFEEREIEKYGRTFKKLVYYPRLSDEERREWFDYSPEMRGDTIHDFLSFQICGKTEVEAPLEVSDGFPYIEYEVGHTGNVKMEAYYFQFYCTEIDYQQHLIVTDDLSEIYDLMPMRKKEILINFY